MLLDTSVLIDLQRELAAGHTGPACALLDGHRDQPLWISVVTLGEFAEGFADVEGTTLTDLVAGLGLLAIDRAVALIYARLSRQMRAEKWRIGDNDIWIAATALAHGLCLVTRDTRHMSRISGLSTMAY